MVSAMKGDSSWDTPSVEESEKCMHCATRTISREPNDESELLIPLDSCVPDDILERIFVFLPTASILRAAAVSRRWYRVISSSRFLHTNMLRQRPWYFMFTRDEDTEGCVFDSTLRKWYDFCLPGVDKSSCFTSSSCGLVCILDHDNRRQITLCNPITRHWKKLPMPQVEVFPEYNSVALSVNRKSHDYTLTLASSMSHDSNDFLQWGFAIHRYESATRSWRILHSEVFSGWRGGDDSVICNGVLYCLIHSTVVLGDAGIRHRLIMYELAAGSFQPSSLISTSINAPCTLTCGRLMNSEGRLILVGGIAKSDRLDIVKGIGIWELARGAWQEVSRMPHRFIYGFGELDDVFASCGADNLIFIQSYGSTALLIFDMELKQWRWSEKCHVSKKFPLQLFSGFCFEPRLDILP